MWKLGGIAFLMMLLFVLLLWAMSERIIDLQVRVSALEVRQGWVVNELATQKRHYEELKWKIDERRRLRGEQLL